ncbi:galactose oxidase [Rhodofomes roseus]|uniref:Galactose oxidase n=1 Tax=Rhodofomes roseus TaxID=34475 RepID=A0ABQ8KHH1_9APHY|nr:galactose oxidase [Rhodofomes roseus]KAH9837280.1 galactose oxidase [Rhodofomes roseus]
MPPIGRWSLRARGPYSARSSHCIVPTKSGQVVVYGGELKPRVPIDSATSQDAGEAVRGSVHVVDLGSRSELNGDRLTWTTLSPSRSTDTVKGHLEIPDARVGPSMVLKDRAVYMWGGRGGVDMAPLNERQAGVWRGQLVTSQGSVVWDHLSAEGGPEPRSYHTTAIIEDKVYIHAGCPTAGRLSSLHSFDITQHKWQALASAPDPARGGTSLVTSTVKFGPVLIRYGGFSGCELPKEAGILDMYIVEDDRWVTVAPAADPEHGVPGPRSVHGFQPFQSRSPALSNAIAVLFYGERDASTLGHAGAGTFWNDVWLLSKDKASSDTDGWQWTKVTTDGSTVPEGRGWFASAEWVEDGTSRIVMHGGLLSSNERSDELWELQIE